MEKENIANVHTTLEEVIEGIKMSQNSSNSRTSMRTTASIRCRPILRGVMKCDFLPYVLSFAYRVALKYHIDKIFLKAIRSKPKTPNLDLKDNMYDFHGVQEFAYEYLLECLEGEKKPSEILIDPSEFIEASAAINKRRRQEDKYFYVNDIRDYTFQTRQPHDKGGEDEPIPVLGVFDGHLGPEVAEHCSHLMPYLIAKAYSEDPSTFDPITVLTEVFFKTRVSLYKGFKSGLWKSGSTGTVCIIYRGSIYTAWVGDSQAWLVFDSTQTLETAQSNPEGLFENGLNYDEGMPLTDMIHKPSESEEYVSVCKTGGVVVLKDSDFRQTLTQLPKDANRPLHDFIRASLTLPDPENLDGARVGGQVNLSRSFGDEFSYPGMHSLPSITVCKLNHLKKPLSCLIMASDGLWDDIAGCGPNVSHLVANISAEERTGLSERLVKLAVDSAASDNVTVVVAHLSRLNERLITNSDYYEASQAERGSVESLDNFFPDRKMLWPIMGKSRISSQPNLSGSKISDRGPNGYTEIGMEAKRNVSARLRRWSSETELLENAKSAVTLSSPVRNLDTD